MIEVLKADNLSTIINAKIEDGTINAGLIVVAPLSPYSLVFHGESKSYAIELPEELVNQGITSSLDDISLPFSIVSQCH